MLTPRRRHRLIGLTLLLPLAVWALTGAFFLVRPGYEQAYERIPVRHYPPPSELSLPLKPEWGEIRYLRSILGRHLIVRDVVEPRGAGSWRHLHAETGKEWRLPGEDDLGRLLQDALSFRPERYGTIVAVEGNRATTDTGVELVIDWPTLSIRQSGRDTRWIDRIYGWHYLRWTGYRPLDTAVGLAGLALLFFLTWTGARLAFTTTRAKPVSDDHTFLM